MKSPQKATRNRSLRKTDNLQERFVLVPECLRTVEGEFKNYFDQKNQSNEKNKLAGKRLNFSFYYFFF